jgi:hypothetical protein
MQLEWVVPPVSRRVRLKNSKYLDAGIFQKPQELAALGAFVLVNLVSSRKMRVVCFELCAILPHSAKPCQVDFHTLDPQLQYVAANYTVLLDSRSASAVTAYT